MNSGRAIVTSLALLLTPVICRADESPTKAEFVPRPAAEPRNRYYAGNREPLLASPLIKLPVGSVQPRGWLRKQLELQSAGFHGHLGDISMFLRKEKNSWLSPDGQGERGWEEVPYWLKGFGDCAYLLKNEEQIKEAKVWIEGAINSQRADGFFGPRGKGAAATVESTKGKYDLWPNMVMLHCLQSYYEYSGDRRVLDLITKYFRWEMSVPEADFLPPYWQQQRAADNLWSVLWLYNHTGDKFLLDLAGSIHRHTAAWTDGVPDWHNVNMCEAFGGPAYYYPVSKDEKHLHAAERNYQKIRELYGQVPGGLFGGDEICRPGYNDPRQAIETCGMVEFMFSCERLLAIHGDRQWADRCEDVAFNSLPAALTADFKCLRYLTSPNMIVSDKKNKAPGLYNGGNQLEMNPYEHRCCQHNFGHGWPYFAEHLWMATGDNGLAAVMYSPCEVTAKVADGAEVSIKEKTRYPFEEPIELIVETKQPAMFPLYLRVPGWCTELKLQVNGKQVPAPGKAEGYLKLTRTWSDGDHVKLVLPMEEIRIERWAKNKGSVSIERGPLTFSLKIGEKYVRSGGTDKWPAYEIYATTPWNYGLEFTRDSADRFGLLQKKWPESDMPFRQEDVPIELRAQARRIPQWRPDYLGLVGLLQPSPAKTSEPEEGITLIPMGAARLRITQFPIATTSPNAREWVVPPEALPVKITASHCWQNDSVRAVADNLQPKNSNDHTILRFTWWDHRGTQEWIEREFDAARKVSGVEVYWFDDEPNKGGCRTPQTWRLLYRKDGKWLEVPRAGAYGIAKDKFNEVRFDQVATDALRMEVQLRKDFSGGILAWTVK
jgi:hypothetical protein